MSRKFRFEGDAGSARFPEHEKLHGVVEQSQWLGGFLEWLEQGELKICRIKNGAVLTLDYSIEQWLALYLEVDLVRIHKEKQEMLEMLRRAQAKRKPRR